MNRQPHAIEEITSVRHGAVIACRCGWTAHITERGGSDFSYQGGAREAYREHKRTAGDQPAPQRRKAGGHAYQPDDRGLCAECGGARGICAATR